MVIVCLLILITIIYHDFLLPPRRGTHVKSDNTHIIINIHTLAHILDIFHLDSLYFRPFYRLSQPHHVTASNPSPGDNHQSTGGRSDRTQGQAKMAEWNSFGCICTRALHSVRSFAHWRAASSVIPLLPKATFTPSIQPNLGLPRTRPPFTFACNTLLDIRYSSILNTCQNHLNTLWSALLANYIFIPALPRTSSFLTLSISDTPTKFLKHFNSRKFTFFLSALIIPHTSAPYSAVGTITYSYIDISWHLSPVLYCSAHFSELPMHALYPSFILWTTSISHPFRLILLYIYLLVSFNLFLLNIL